MSETIIKSRKIKFEKKKIKIDGITFDEPKDLGDHIVFGCVGLIIILTLPLWIWFWLISKFILSISTQVVEVKYKEGLICPKCSGKLKKGNLERVECMDCRWYKYLDMDDVRIVEEQTAVKKDE